MRSIRHTNRTVKKKYRSCEDAVNHKNDYKMDDTLTTPDPSTYLETKNSKRPDGLIAKKNWNT